MNRVNKSISIIDDSTKINQNEILKRSGLAGYNSDKLLAPMMSALNLNNYWSKTVVTIK